MSINSKMTAIADPIRTLKGTSGKMGLDAMASNLVDAVNECDTQADLITQIKTALADKAAGGVELPTLENPGTASDLVQGKQLIGADGSVVEGTVTEHTPESGDLYKSMTSSDWVSEYDPEEGNYCLHRKDTFENDAFVRSGSFVNDYVWGSELGNAKREDVPQGVTFTSENGLKIEGSLPNTSNMYFEDGQFTVDYRDSWFEVVSPESGLDFMLNKGGTASGYIEGDTFGDAKPEDVRAGVYFTSKNGLKIPGTAILPGGGSVYPEGAFAPVTNFTDGKQYALVAVIDGVRRYINTTTYNDYTMNATEITIGEDAGDYVIFGATPSLFTAVASGDGFLLQNGSNYLHGTSSGGTALRVGTTQMVWTVDISATGGFSDGKYYAKEDANAVWLMNADGGYSWSIKYETAGSFGYDRDGRDGTYSTGFVSFVLYEYVAGEGELNPIVDTSDANVTANKMLAGYSGYANGRKVNGNIELQSKTVTANGTVTPDAGKLLSSVVVNVPTGSSGSTIKTGTTTSGTINTGLSDIEQFFIYKETQTATGLIHLHYTKDTTFRMYASAWSTSNYGTKTITNGAGGVTVSGGTLTLSATQAAQGALSSGVTYKWVAIGKE